MNEVSKIVEELLKPRRNLQRHALRNLAAETRRSCWPCGVVPARMLIGRGAVAVGRALVKLGLAEECTGAHAGFALTGKGIDVLFELKKRGL